MNKGTSCVQAGTYEDTATGGVNTPIFTSSSFEYLDREEILYPRNFNTPNQQVVARKLCALEQAEDAILFSSGMAAISTVLLSELGRGDHVILLDALYGGTHAFVTGTFERFGIGYDFVHTDVESIRSAMRPETRAIVIESPTNPLMEIIDIRAVAALGAERGITTIMDNTFASPINQNPLSLGIDIVVHSGTKYLGGHSDLCCGVALTSKARRERIWKLANHLGGSLNAATCYLLERSLKTLAIRVERQSSNAQKVAEVLESKEGVIRVHYPGLSSFPGHEIARSQMRAFGGMLSFELGDSVDSREFLGRLKLIRPAVSLGGVETIICSPAETSHHKISAEERRRVGITPALLRLSVGIEDADDLIADLDGALTGL